MPISNRNGILLRRSVRGPPDDFWLRPGHVRTLFGSAAAVYRWFRSCYGARPLILLTSFALVGYVVQVMGLTALSDSAVWWRGILVWFVGAIVLHDLVLFPLYALADRALTRVLRRRRTGTPEMPPANYVRIPVLASGLLFLLFFPGITEQGASSHLAVTGQTQEPFLTRWLLITALGFGVSAITYALRVRRAHRRERGTTG